ncbi:MAG TPA: MEDS domain-containing protein [Xanthobacteraceae bacterium]
MIRRRLGASGARPATRSITAALLICVSSISLLPAVLSASRTPRLPNAAVCLRFGRGRKPTRRQTRSGQTCLWANMGWALMDFPGTHDIVEYESRINYMLPKYDMATLGTYDLAKFSASLVMDVLRTTRACDRWRHIAREPVLRAAG